MFDSGSIFVNPPVTYGTDGKHGLLQLLNIRYSNTNWNPNNDSDADDCVVRSVCAILADDPSKPNEDDYKHHYLGLTKSGLNHYKVMNHIGTIHNYLKKYHYVAVEPNMVVSTGTFLATHRFGRYIVGCDNHCFAYIDGAIYDTYQIMNDISFALGHPVKVVFCKEDNLRNLF